MLSAYSAVLPVYPAILLEDTLRYVLAASLIHLLTHAALPQLVARRGIRATARPGWAQIRREIAVSLRTALIFSAVGLSIAAGAHAGIFRVYLEICDRGWVWFAASVVLMILAHDAWFYWAHRLMHRPRLYRALHAEHHRSHNPTAFAAYRFDVTEALAQATFLPAFLLVLPVHPAAILAFTTHMIVRNAMGHCGVELFPARAEGRPRIGWMTTVTHHDLHHADARWNLGLYFTWWDRWCGTEHPGYAQAFARSVRAATGAACLLAVALLLAAAPVGAQTGGGVPPRGDFAAGGLALVLRFAPCSADPAETCGRVVHGWTAAARLQVKRGALMIDGLRPASDGWRGWVTDPRTGRSLAVTLHRVDRDTLVLRGCPDPVCPSGIWHSTRWLRSVQGGIRPPV